MSHKRYDANERNNVRVCNSCLQCEHPISFTFRPQGYQLRYDVYTRTAFIDGVDDMSPEYAVGLLNGCKVIAINGKMVELWNDQMIADKLNKVSVPFTVTLDYRLADMNFIELKKRKIRHLNSNFVGLGRYVYIWQYQRNNGAWSTVEYALAMKLQRLRCDDDYTTKYSNARNCKYTVVKINRDECIQFNDATRTQRALRRIVYDTERKKRIVWQCEQQTVDHDAWADIHDCEFAMQLLHLKYDDVMQYFGDGGKYDVRKCDTSHATQTNMSSQIQQHLRMVERCEDAPDEMLTHVGGGVASQHKLKQSTHGLHLAASSSSDVCVECAEQGQAENKRYRSYRMLSVSVSNIYNATTTPVAYDEHFQVQTPAAELSIFEIEYWQKLQQDLENYQADLSNRSHRKKNMAELLVFAPIEALVIRQWECLKREYFQRQVELLWTKYEDREGSGDDDNDTISIEEYIHELLFQLILQCDEILRALYAQMKQSYIHGRALDLVMLNIDSLYRHSMKRKHRKRFENTAMFLQQRVIDVICDKMDDKFQCELKNDHLIEFLIECCHVLWNVIGYEYQLCPRHFRMHSCSYDPSIHSLYDTDGAETVRFCVFPAIFKQHAFKTKIFVVGENESGNDSDHSAVACDVHHDHESVNSNNNKLDCKHAYASTPQSIAITPITISI